MSIMWMDITAVRNTSDSYSLYIQTLQSS